jgi:transcriptional regulator with XRE-family HTH domain
MHVTNLKLMRMRRGLRQWKLAAAVGISEGYLSKIETGRVPAPADLLQRLADELEVGVGEINEPFPPRGAPARDDDGNGNGDGEVANA